MRIMNITVITIATSHNIIIIDINIIVIVISIDTQKVAVGHIT